MNRQTRCVLLAALLTAVPTVSQAGFDVVGDAPGDSVVLCGIGSVVRGVFKTTTLGDGDPHSRKEREQRLQDIDAVQRRRAAEIAERLRRAQEAHQPRGREDHDIGGQREDFGGRESGFGADHSNTG